jgi:hypothetical protein
MRWMRITSWKPGRWKFGIDTFLSYGGIKVIFLKPFQPFTTIDFPLEAANSSIQFRSDLSTFKQYGKL